MSFLQGLHLRVHNRLLLASGIDILHRTGVYTVTSEQEEIFLYREKEQAVL
jgi:hypothetical protein